MSYTVDANVLLYASDASSPYHDQARTFVERSAAGPELVYLFWPVATTYLRLSTHPAIFERPLTPDEAVSNLEGLLRRSHVRSPGEGDGFWDVYRSTVTGLVVRGNLVSDAHLAALMRQYGVMTIWTRDRDFQKFPGLRVRDFIDESAG